MEKAELCVRLEFLIGEREKKLFVFVSSSSSSFRLHNRVRWDIHAVRLSSMREKSKGREWEGKKKSLFSFIKQVRISQKINLLVLLPPHPLHLGKMKNFHTFLLYVCLACVRSKLRYLCTQSFIEAHIHHLASIIFMFQLWKFELFQKQI